MMAPARCSEADMDIETEKLVHSLTKLCSLQEFGFGQVAGDLLAKSSGQFLDNFPLMCWKSRLRSEMLERTLLIILDVENLP